jgi:hypothetical protein
MTPNCPAHYSCTFTPLNPPHYYAHWYDGPWGIVVAILIVAGFVIVACTAFYYWKEHADTKRAAVERERGRQNQLAIEEQRTMQLDAAKGNPEMLKLVRESYR